MEINEFKIKFKNKASSKNAPFKSNSSFKLNQTKCKYLMSLIFILSSSVCKAEFNDQFNQTNSFHFEIKENTIENQLIGSVHLVKGLNYRFANSQLTPEFKLDANGNIFTTKFRLDRERQQYYDLIILNKELPTTNPIQVKIVVKDENDNLPYFSNAGEGKQLAFSESAPIGSKIILDTASDLDDEDELRYELIYCVDEQRCACVAHQNLVNLNNNVNKNVNSLSVNSKPANNSSDNDKVTFNRPFKLNFNQTNSIPLLNLELIERLDRESIASYNCKLCVFDLQNQSNHLNLHIKISDINDNQPLFGQSNYTITLNHNLKKGDLILSVHAIDLDEPNTANSKLTYSLEGTDDFYINQTGSIAIANDGLPTCSDSNQISNQLNQFSSDQFASNQQLIRSSCVFSVICMDNGNPKQQSKAYVTIYLSSTDNLNVPEIRVHFFNHRFVQYAIVDQNAIYGTAVAAISVIDLDNGKSGQTKLDIVSGNAFDHFYLDSELSASTGSYVIRVNHNFTNSSISKSDSFNLTIKATDYGQPQLASIENLIIKVSEQALDKNKPTFNQQIYRVDILENAPIGSFICLVNAFNDNLDHQQSIGYFYSLSGNNSDYFNIDSSQTGMVTLAKQLDRELISDFDLKIYVRDGYGHLNSEWSSAKLLIRLLDINDNRVKVIKKDNFKPNYEIIDSDKEETILKIVEGSRVSYEFEVIDEDYGENGSLIVELLYNYQGLFGVNTTSCLHRKEKLIHLFSTKELDYELVKCYELLFILTDQGSPRLTSQFKIRIDVQDEDDLPTKIYPKHYFLNLNKSIKENSDKLMKIRTIDQDKASLVKYFFNFNHNHKNLNFVNSLVSIDEFAGVIQLKKQSTIDLNQFPKYLPFNVTCDNCDRLNQQATIHLFINNGENVIKHKHLAISELSELRTIILDNILTTLFDNLDAYQLLIADGDSEQTFKINENNQLLLAKRLDYEKTSEYNLTICAFNLDQFKLGNVILKIKNENNQHPKFEKPFVYLELQRDQPFHQSVFKLNAIDSDDLAGEDEISSNIVYHFFNNNAINQQQSNNSASLIKDANYMFRINKNQLELNVNLFERKLEKDNELVYEFKGDYIYLISIQARDLNLKADLQPQNTASRMLSVFIKIKDPILDEKDLFNSLEILKSNYELNIEESKQINSKLIKFDLLYAKQLDGLLAFEFANDELIKNQFGLFPDGTLYLKNKLDREQNENFILQIAVKLKSAVAAAKDDQKKIITVLIHVLDNNNNAPKFEKEVYHFYVKENSPASTPIGTVKAIDKDLNSLINYRLLPSKLSNSIGLNSLTGHLYLKAPVDYEAIKLITLEIEAEDRPIFEKSLKSKCKIVIEVLNVNDCEPCFELFDSQTNSYQCASKLKQQISIMENLKLHTTIHEFKVRDQDTANDQLRFTLIESEFSSSFNLNASTGKLKLAKNLDREINERIELLVRVDDGLHEAFNRFIIKLEDINDSVPFWQNKANQTTSLRIVESAEPGTILFALEAIDYDIGLNGQIHFEITNVESIKSDNSDLCTNHQPFCEQADCFKIERNRLVLANYLDYENERAYEINLTAIDYYGLRSEILTIKLNVTNLNDCRPKFKSQLNEDTISIFENVKINTTILELNAFDCDENDELSYELVKCQILPNTYHKKCPLELDAKTGKLIAVDNLDYEEIKRLNLKIKVTDLNEQHADTKELSMIIQNLNDNKPKIAVSTSFVVLRPEQQPVEKNEILGQLIAIDLDKDRVVYRLSPEADEKENQINLDESDGFIYAKSRIQQNTEFKFPVHLIDEFGLYTTELIKLVILFANTSLDTLDFVFDVHENESIGYLIHKFKCNTNCKFHMNTCDKLFSVDENGELRIESNLDRELKSTYYFDIFMINGQLSSIQMFKIKINILDRNDNKPVIIGNLIERSIRVKENERIKKILFDLSTIVNDFDLNTQFQFNQLNCTASFNNTQILVSNLTFDNPFLIESNSGKIVLVSSF